MRPVRGSDAAAQPLPRAGMLPSRRGAPAPLLTFSALHRSATSLPKLARHSRLHVSALLLGFFYGSVFAIYNLRNAPRSVLESISPSRVRRPMRMPPSWVDFTLDNSGTAPQCGRLRIIENLWAILRLLREIFRSFRESLLDSFACCLHPYFQMARGAN